LILYETNKKTILHNNEIEKKLGEIKHNIILLEAKLKELNDELTKNIITCEKNNLIIEHNNNMLQELNELKFNTQTYKCLSDITGVNGIPIYLLEKRLSEFTNKINCILRPFINKTIELDITDDGGVDIIVKTHDEKTIHTLGGMESMMLDLTFKIIISQMSIMPKCGLIFIDESISVMDKNRINNIDELFSFLKQYYSNVFLITHIEEVKYKIDKHLYISKIGDKSLLRNIDGLMYFDIDNDLIEENIKSDFDVNIEKTLKTNDSETQLLINSLDILDDPSNALSNSLSNGLSNALVFKKETTIENNKLEKANKSTKLVKNIKSTNLELNKVSKPKITKTTNTTKTTKITKIN
jgi:hypothetical protein